MSHASGASADRIFDIATPDGGATPTVVISGLEVTGGTANSSNSFFGGDIRNSANLTLNEDWITGGTTQNGSGAGVSNNAGTLLVEHSLVSGNGLNPSGGASNGNDSGGIQNFGTSSQPGHLTVIDTTVSGNQSEQGGGIFSWCFSACSNTTSVVNSTIVHNDGGNRATGGGGLQQGVGAGTITVQNSIVAFNTVSNPSANTANNCGGPGISSLGYNIESGTDCGFHSTGDHQSTDPKFTSATLHDNGGNTDTFAPDVRTSPAVDAIPPGAPGCNGTDQRDVARPQGARCDIGAVEVFPIKGPPSPVTTGAPSVTSSSAAVLKGSAGPNGLPTTGRWLFGVDASQRGPGFNGNALDQSTPSQFVGSDFSSHSVSFPVTGLLPNTTYDVQFVATNADGTTSGPQQTFTTPKAPVPVIPPLGTENFTASNGPIFVMVHGQFVKLNQTLTLPSGTIVNAQQGSLTLVSSSAGTGGASDARANKKPKKFTATFHGGVFKVTQTRFGPNRGLTTLTLIDNTPAFKGAPSFATTCKAKGSPDGTPVAGAAFVRRIYSVRGRASGHYSLHGRRGSGSIRGTVWTLTDRCDGTLITVQQHSVLVTDFVKHITLLVTAGHSYLAKEPTHGKKKKK